MSKNKFFTQGKIPRERTKKKNLSLERPPLADYIKYHRSIIIALVFGAIGFLTIPNLLILPYSRLEGSWIIGLNMAKVSGLQFGKDIVFPFGPLGFMYCPAYCEFNTWLISSAFCLFVHCLFIFSIVIMIKKLSISPIDCVLMGITLMLALPQTSIEYKVLFSILILLYLSIVSPLEPKPKLILYVFISFMMAAASLIKFTAMLVSGSILIFMIVFCLYKKRIIPLCCILFSYIGSILLLLVLTGQKIANFPAYLLNSYELSDGYSSAMARIGPIQQVIIGFCILAVLGLVLLNSILKNKPGIIYFILISAGFVFVSFKHGLVRQDASHIYIFFANAMLILISMYITNKKQLTLLMRSLILILVFILAAAIFKHSPSQMIPDIGGKLKMLGSAVSLATDDAAARTRILEHAKEKMRTLKDETIKYIGSKSVDIMPWEISTVYAYGLNWTPRPVFQCYSAYTDKLDMLNSQYLESDKAPDFLLYAHGAIDGRYTLFDAPATFRTILKNYKPVLIDDKNYYYIILRKTDTRSLSTPKTISSLDSEIGKPIPVPQIKDGYLFAKIYMDYNLLGKIANLIYKPPSVYIQLSTDETTREYRFIFSAARNGIFLSEYLHNMDDLVSIWNGKVNNNLDSIAISTQYPAFYNKNIHVEFFEVPL
jgi:hypothetical protein